MNAESIIAQLKTKEGEWANPNRVATMYWSMGGLDGLEVGLEHLAPDYAEPLAVELWLGIDFPLQCIDFRILAVTDRGLWIDNGDARVGSHTVMIPWTSIFALHVYTTRSLKVPQRQGEKA